MGAFDRIDSAASSWRRLWKSIGLVLLVAGVLELVGAAAGGDNWLRPLESQRLLTRRQAEWSDVRPGRGLTADADLEALWKSS